MHANPQPRENRPINPKHLQPISLLSCLSNTFETILTQGVALADQLTGTISPAHYGSRAELSAINTLLIAVTLAQEWLLELSKPSKLSKGPNPTRPLFLANQIKGPLHCAVHKFLIMITTNDKLPHMMVRTVANRMSLDCETEPCALGDWGDTSRLPHIPMACPTRVSHETEIVFGRQNHHH